MQLNEILLDVPVFEITEPESAGVDETLFYFACTPSDFLIYANEKKCWYGLETKKVLPGRISDVIDNKGDIFLYDPSQPVESGKWGHCTEIDPILELWSSGNWREWLADQMNK